MGCRCTSSSQQTQPLNDAIGQQMSGLNDDVTVSLGAALIGAAVGVGVGYAIDRSFNPIYAGIGAAINGIFLKWTF